MLSKLPALLAALSNLSGLPAAGALENVYTGAIHDCPCRRFPKHVFNSCTVFYWATARRGLETYIHLLSSSKFTRAVRACMHAPRRHRLVASYRKTNDIWEMNLQPTLWPCYVHYVGVLGCYSNTPTWNVCFVGFPGVAITRV